MTRIKIIDTQENQVKFSCSLGIGWAKWGVESPAIGACYDVEWDVDDDFEWGRNIQNALEPTSAIETMGRTMFLVAQALTYESDRILTISLGGDVIFLNVSSAPSTSGYVCFFTSTDNVTLYPVEL